LNKKIQSKTNKVVKEAENAMVEIKQKQTNKKKKKKKKKK